MNRYAYINPQGQQVEITADTPESALSQIAPGSISDSSSGVMYLGPATTGGADETTDTSDETGGDTSAIVLGEDNLTQEQKDAIMSGDNAGKAYADMTPEEQAAYIQKGADFQNEMSSYESKIPRYGGSTPPPTPKPIQRSIYGNTSGGQNTLGKGGYTSSGGIGEGGLADEQKKREDYLAGLSAEEPKTEAQIADELTLAAKDQISALGELKSSLLSDQARVNDLRTRETNAQSVMSGLMGSSEAGNRAIATEDKNKAANKSIQAAYANDLAKIYTDIQDKAYTRAKDAKDTFITASKDYLTNLEAKKKEAEEDVITLAKSGFDFDAIKKSDPTTYNDFVNSVGGEDKLKALITLNRSQETIIDKRLENGKYIIAYQNPLTGKTRIETVDLGLPIGYSKTIDAGDRILAIPDNWGGDPSDLITINKGLTPTQQEKAGGTTGVYTPGENPVVDAWAERIQAGTAKITEIPTSQAGLRNQVTLALQQMGNDPTGKPTVTEMGKAANATAKDLLGKLTSGRGTSAIGKSGALASFGYGLIPGTDRADFVATFDSLKAQLALDAVKFLKGQGAVSDAERALLGQAVTKLTLSQSEEEFKKTLEFIISKLSGAPEQSAGMSGADALSSNKSSTIKLRNKSTGEISNYAGTLTPEEADANGYEIIQ